MRRRLRHRTVSTVTPSTRTSETPTARVRWAAIGAALAVAVGAVGPSLVPSAAATVSSGEKAIYRPIEPCRLIDTRPTSNVGVQPGQVGPADTYVIQVRGNTDPCPSNIPAAASALALNVTAVDQTAPTFLTFWGDGDRPTTSNLNPVPGEPPTPNAVTVPLGAGGAFKFFNLQGGVHVIIDVMGYFIDHDHDDRYYPQSVADARFALSSDTYSKSDVDSTFAPLSDTYSRSFTLELIRNRQPEPLQYVSPGACRADQTGPGDPRDGEWDVCLTIPADPTSSYRSVIITVDMSWHTLSGGATGACRVTIDGSPALRGEFTMGHTSDVTSSTALASTSYTLYALSVTNIPLALECQEREGDIDWEAINMTVVGIPA